MPENLPEAFRTFLNSLLRRDFFFVAYRLPGSQQIRVMIQTAGEITPYENNQDSDSFVFQKFFSDNQPPLCLKSDLSYTDSDFPLHLPASPLYDRKFEAAHQDGDSREQYLKDVALLVSEMHQENVEKIVYSRCIPIHDDPKDLIAVFENLEAQNPNAFVYLLHLPGNITWLGASPETLMSASQGKMNTMALAGTRPTQKNNPANWGKKELHEHAVVVSDIITALNDLQLVYEKSGPHSRVINDDITHLCTEFTIAQKNPTDLWKLIDKLHPTPAVSGTPKQWAIQRIREIESHDRWLYCGFLGIVRPGIETRLFVNLRCAVFSESGNYLFAGGGLTAGSDPEAEWLETELKQRTILNSLSFQ